MALLKDIYIATRTRNVEDAGTTNAPKLLVSRGSQDLLLVPLEGDIDGLGRGRAAVFKIDVLDQKLDSANLVVRLLASGDDAWAPEHILVWGVAVETPAVQGNNGIAPLAALIDIALPGSARSAGIWLSTDSSEGVSEILVSPIAPPLPTLPPSRAQRIIVIVATDQYPSMWDPGPGPGGNREDVGTNGPVTLQAGRFGGPLFVSYQLPKTPQGDLARGHANFYLTLVAGAFGLDDDDIGSDGVFTLTINSQDWWIPDYFAVFGIDSSVGQPATLIPFTQDADFRYTNFGDCHIFSTDPAQGWHSVRLSNAWPISP
jgi:hypothetical protein